MAKAAWADPDLAVPMRSEYVITALRIGLDVFPKVAYENYDYAKGIAHSWQGKIGH